MPEKQRKSAAPNDMHKEKQLKTDTEIGIIMCCVKISGVDISLCHFHLFLIKHAAICVAAAFVSGASALA